MNTSSMNSHENGKLHIRKIKWLKLGNLFWHVTPQGLSLADRACIALGIKLQIPIYTADRIWDELKLDNIDIRLIR